MTRSAGVRIFLATCTRCAAVAGLALASAEVAHAAHEQRPSPHDEPLESPKERSSDPEPSLVSVRWFGSQYVTPNSEFDDADVDIARSRLGVKVTAPVSKRMGLTVTLRGEVSRYDFHGQSDLISGMLESGDPFDPLYQTDLRLAGRYRLTDTLSLLGGGFTRASFESGADFDDSIKGGGFAAAGYDFRKRVSIVLGLGLSSRLRRSGVRVRPVFRLKAQLSDTLRLDVSGLGFRLASDVAETLQISLVGRYEGRRYRLRNIGNFLRAGTLQDRQLPLGVELSWRARRWLDLGFTGGAILYQRLRTFDQDGDRRRTDTARPAPYAGMRLRLRF